MTTQTLTQSNKLKGFVNSTLGRLVIVAILIGAVFGGNVVAAHFKHDKYADARRAADNSLTAYTHCDVQTAKKYYVAFQTDATAVSNYQKQCVKGAISFSYDTPNSYSSKTVNHVQTIDETLIYSASQKGGTASRFLVSIHWNSTSKQWTISSISAAPTSTSSTSATKAS